MYTSFMDDLGVAEAREGLANAISAAESAPVRITKHGKPVAVLINPSLYESFIEAMEELEDIAAFDLAIEDESPNVPWEQVKKDLSLT